jgi:hypothetical protein
LISGGDMTVNIAQSIKQEGFVNIGLVDELVLQAISKEIKGTVLKVLRQNKITMAANMHLQDYHKFVDGNLHSLIWPKTARLFNKEFVSTPLIKNWLSSICANFSDFEVLDIEGIGYAEIYFRLVRPN